MFKQFRTYLREPLLHFLLIGALLFASYSWCNPDSSSNPETIVIDTGRITALQEQFAARWKRPPISTELDGLIDEFVLTEAYAREAIKLGLDQDDPVIKRRLRQIMEMMSGDITSLIEPDDETLQSYLDSHQESFLKEPIYTFLQIYINPNKHGENMSAYITEIQRSLSKGDDVALDPSPLPGSFNHFQASRIDREFGAGFSDQLDNLSIGEWSSPVSSGVGLHFIKLIERKPARIPDLIEVRDRVIREYVYEMRKEMQNKQREQLISTYDVIIESSVKKDVVCK